MQSLQYILQKRDFNSNSMKYLYIFRLAMSLNEPTRDHEIKLATAPIYREKNIVRKVCRTVSKYVYSGSQ